MVPFPAHARVNTNIPSSTPFHSMRSPARFLRAIGLRKKRSGERSTTRLLVICRRRIFRASLTSAWSMEPMSSYDRPIGSDDDVGSETFKGAINRSIRLLMKSCPNSADLSDHALVVANLRRPRQRCVSERAWIFSSRIYRRRHAASGGNKPRSVSRSFQFKRRRQSQLSSSHSRRRCTRTIGAFCFGRSDISSYSFPVTSVKSINMGGRL